MGFLQVVRNLLDNALRFAPEGSSIGVKVAAFADLPESLPGAWRPRMALSGAGYAMISISDSGVGVPDSEKSRVFEKFHRTHRKESNQGFGLGLAICRTIVEGHKGAIWVEDKPGGGSVFSFLIGV
jgi:signal transduction histidine kinase